MATEAAKNTPKKPRKARSNDRRNNLKLIREKIRTIISERNKSEKFVGMHFTLSDRGQATLLAYAIVPAKPETVVVIPVTDAEVLRQAMAADLHK